MCIYEVVQQLHSGDNLLFADNALKELPSAQPDLCDGCDRYEVSCVGEGCGKLEAPKEGD